MTRVIIMAACGVLAAAGVQAQVANKYNITPQEQADCELDAATLCASAYPDQDRLIVCLRANRSSLSPRCLKTFTAGLARRHL